jgi:hypothetical protein
MNRIVASLFAIACAVGIPLAAEATVYTINVPLNLTRLAAPAGTVFQMGCLLYAEPYTEVVQQNLYPDAQGYQNTAALNSNGDLTSTVTVKITSSKPMKSYLCTLNPVGAAGANPNPYQLIPNFKGAVNGSL